MLRVTQVLRASARPVEIKLRPAGKSLEIAFNNGKTMHYSAEYLRVHSPSAEGLGFGPRPPVAAKKYVSVVGVKPVGHYAIQITFDDRHETGIYSWDLLYNLGENKWPIMRQYIKDLKKWKRKRVPRTTTTTTTTNNTTKKDDENNEDTNEKQKENV